MGRKGVIRRDIFLILKERATRRTIVIRELKRMGIPYKVTENGIVTMVDMDAVYTLQK